VFRRAVRSTAIPTAYFLVFRFAVFFFAAGFFFAAVFFFAGMRPLHQ
jgi:hypothetical protein